MRLAPLPPVDDRTRAWMDAKHRDGLNRRIGAQLKQSRRSGAKRVLIAHADLEELMSR